MRGQTWYVAGLIGLMCLVRFGLSTIAYADPDWLMEQLGMPLASNVQAPYVVRAWAIRDIVLAVLVVFANPCFIKTLLFACIAIDATDIVSAHLSGTAGLFNAADTWSLKWAAIAALVPEVVALALIGFQKTQEQIDVKTG
jgi:hypothetical protein